MVSYLINIFNNKIPSMTQCKIQYFYGRTKSHPPLTMSQCVSYLEHALIITISAD